MHYIHVTHLEDANKETNTVNSLEEAFVLAASFLEEPVTIFLAPGIYEEKVVCTVPFVTLCGTGERPEDTVICFSEGANDILANGERRGTFRSAVFRTDTDDFTARNLSFENTAGPGAKAGQAIAVYADGDRQFFDNCRFVGWQDTLFTAPLPPYAMQPDGFRGPKEFAPRVNGRQYYRNCYFSGEIDFIFGSATAYFEGCEFFSRDTGRPVNGYVTAASTAEGQEYGYVLENCRFTSNCPDHSVYLGRPWRAYAKVVLLHCDIGPHIFPEGFDDWSPNVGHEHLYFAEYGCTGACCDRSLRPAWTTLLSDEEALHYQKELVLDGWDPVNSLPS